MKLDLISPFLEAQTQDSSMAVHPWLDAVGAAVRDGLGASPKWLPAWLFYDAEGSRLFECITLLPEYYLTRTERSIFAGYADGILARAFQIHELSAAASKPLRVIELGAGSASKTGILLAAAVRRQGRTEYLPIDVSASAMEEACNGIARVLKDVVVSPQIANYVTDVLTIPPNDGPTLALYIGSSIGNFSPEEAVQVLRNLRMQLRPGDSLLLGTDLVKDSETLTAAYDDAAGVTAAFNLNLLRRLNRELGADFDLHAFRHEALWNGKQSRMEMHLRSLYAQTVRFAELDLSLSFVPNESIHTESSYKFTESSIRELLDLSGFRVDTVWSDERKWFAVTLAAAV